MGHVACRFEGYWRKPVPLFSRDGSKGLWLSAMRILLFISRQTVYLNCLRIKYRLTKN